MRLLFCLLTATALSAQDAPKEVKLPAPGGELRYLYAAGSGAPLLVVLPDSTDEAAIRKQFAQWQAAAASAGWNCMMPLVAGVSDQTAKGIQMALSDVRKQIPKIDETRVYLAGQGPSTPEVFYSLSRTPDLWAAGLAIQGSPGPAIQSFRLFGANTQVAPLLWIAPAGDVDMFRARLTAVEFNFEARADAKTNEIFEWLAKHQRAAFPSVVDCETGNPAFGRCYWIEMTKFDPKKRNDVLKSTRVPAGSGASLAIGPFGYDPQAEGPGALVGWLPPSYSGPLKLNDRIVSVAGKEVADGREYARILDEITDEKPVAVLVQRGKQRTRVETKILLPKREELITARVQGRYLPDQKEVFLISRAVTAMRVHIPAEWAPVSVSWNGLDLVKAEAEGCWVLSMEKEPPEAAKCP